MIAVDAMGGDKAPGVVIQGCLAAARKGVSITLFGPADKLESLVVEHAKNLLHNTVINIVHAPDVIEMDEEPVSAVKKKQKASLVLAVDAVARGQCSAVISAGNSGALLVAASLIVGRQEGVERPAIAGFLPGLKHRTLTLDLGGNTECRPLHILQFAHMGNLYLQKVHGVSNPRIGLLSNGHEEGKGSLLCKESYLLLKNDSTIHFIGNVEPYDIFNGKVGLLVTDGFSGNILLKSIEATLDFVSSLDAEIFSALQNIFNQNNGAALLLGVKKPVLVCHGNADSNTIEKAIMYAKNVSDRNFYNF